MVTKATTSWSDASTTTEEREVHTHHVMMHYDVLHALRVIKCSHTYGSNWLYVGTDKSNVHLVCVEGLVLSAYTIPWNNVVEQ